MINEEPAAPDSTLLGRKILIVILFVTWVLSQVTTHLFVPSYDTIMAAISPISPESPYTKSKHD